MKKCLQEEFSQSGIEVEGLKIEIENLEEVNDSKKAIENRYSRIYIYYRPQTCRQRKISV
jgi:hypothetical protein